MEEQSFHDKDSSTVHRLSEPRPIFKPVLVKKLLADESDDDSDEQVQNSDNSEEEIDDFDSFQPLPEECTADMTPKTLVAKTDINLTVEEKISISDDNVRTSEVSNIKIAEEVKQIGISDNAVKIKENEQKPIYNSYLKDSLRISDSAAIKNEEEKLSLKKSSSVIKRKNCMEFSENESAAGQYQWNPQSYENLDKRKSLAMKEQSESNVKPRSYSPEIKRHTHNTIVNQTNEVKDKPAHHFALKDGQEANRYSSSNLNRPYSINNEPSDDRPSKMQIDQMGCSKNSTANSTSNSTLGVMHTPMKHPQGSTRPTPCHSHRNIFQTPQNKISTNEFAKNPTQTPATIFSHWSQQHMAQTPMQNQIPPKRESVQTPASSIVQSQNSRYFSSETKSVRRPLAETMYSERPVHGPQLPRLQEVANESQPSVPISRDNSNLVMHENMKENKSVYSSSHASHESKENRNSNLHDIKNENHINNQQQLPENRYASDSHMDTKRIIDNYLNTVFNQNIQPSRNSENYEKYQVQESQNVQPLVHQQEGMPTIQCTIPQQTTAPRPSKHKIISVNHHQYMVLGVLGRGGSCEVLRAQDLSNSEMRAIKCVDLSKMDKDSTTGCLQEICMLDRLKAPCIVHMYTFELRQPWLKVVMEVGDTDLSRLLKSMLQEKKQLTLTMILYYWTEMLTAVHHIHENGVIHSDLKPANFLLVRGRLKLIDFGIASNINADMTSVIKNCPIGTLNYISPEAMLDVNNGSTDSPHNVKYKISPKSDVWSLGCILYGLVYGSTPFSHIRQHWAKITAITDPKHKIKYPLMIGSEKVPPILIDVMRKCLQRDPKARPTVADLIEIPYLQGNISPYIVPNIPSTILMKIKNALDDEEWQKFTEILEKKVKP